MQLPGPRRPSAGNKGPFLRDEWAQCEWPPFSLPSRPPALGRMAGVSVPRGRAAIWGKSSADAQGRLCGLRPRAGAPQGTAVTPKGGVMARSQRGGLCHPLFPPAVQRCSWWSQQNGSTGGCWWPLATGGCGDALARWHSRLICPMMFSSIDKSIIDDPLSCTWQSAVHAPIVSIKQSSAGLCHRC